MSFISLLPRWTESRWNQPLDRALLDHLEPLAADAGLLGPGPQWTFSTKNLRTLGDMLQAWVGWGRLPVSCTQEEAHAATGYSDFIPRLIRYLEAIDHLDLVNSHFIEHIHRHNWITADLYSVMDVIEITAVIGQADLPKLRIVEIGGGWGRLPEMLLRLFPGKIEYVMIDAVPVSLVSAEAYLRDALPTLRFGSYVRGDSYKQGDYDVYFIPSWHIQHLGAARFDIAVNIESFQEMTQNQLDYFLGWFDSVLVEQGLAYIANSRDYVFLGEWKFPTSWRTLLRHRTPRSWTPDNSTQIFRKERGHFCASNRIVDIAYANTIPTDASDPAVHALRYIKGRGSSESSV